MLFPQTRHVAVGLVCICALVTRAGAQAAAHISTTVGSLDALVADAMTSHPAIRAAQARVDAARARQRAAGTRLDPMLMAGVQNLPLGTDPMNAGGPDPMTMHMVGISQTILYPGKRGLDKAAATDEVTGAMAALGATKQRIMAEVEDAYADLVFADEALRIVHRNHDVLADLVRLAEGRYSVGSATQADVLKANVELTRLAEMASMLTEQRIATVARLNALVSRPSDTSIENAALPDRVARAALGRSPSEIHFTSAALGSRVADSPLPSVAALQAMALANNAELREQSAMISAQAARVALAHKAHLPDFDVSLQYGQRGGGRPDMISATVALPLPLSKHHKQDALSADAAAQLQALDAERSARLTEINAEIARLVTELERARAQLALYEKALLPQGRATVTSSRASYEVGKVDFMTVLDAQATVFTYETDSARARSDFAKNLAALERLVGQEIVQ